MKPSKKLIKETKAIIRLYQFLRYECGLREAVKLSTREIKVLLETVKIS